MAVGEPVPMTSLVFSVLMSNHSHRETGNYRKIIRTIMSKVQGNPLAEEVVKKLNSFLADWHEQLWHGYLFLLADGLRTLLLLSLSPRSFCSCSESVL